MTSYGIRVSRKRVERLMAGQGWQGAFLRRGWRGGSTVQDPRATPAPDLVNRDFTAAGPNRLWVADITYVKTFSGWVYAAFVMDVFSRRIVGWQLSKNLYTDLALDALEMGLWTRARDGHDTSRLVHHSDRGTQYLAVRYTERLAEAGAVANDPADGPERGFHASMKAGT